MDTIALYDRAAPKWERKIHRLGYWRAYSGFLKNIVTSTGPVLDLGTGTGTFAAVWVANNGSPDLTLLDPSGAMLAKAIGNLQALGITEKTTKLRIEDFTPHASYSAILAAHVVEHCADPAAVFCQLFGWLEPGGAPVFGDLQTALVQLACLAALSASLV